MQKPLEKESPPQVLSMPLGENNLRQPTAKSYDWFQCRIWTWRRSQKGILNPRQRLFSLKMLVGVTGAGSTWKANLLGVGQCNSVIPRLLAEGQLWYSGIKTIHSLEPGCWHPLKNGGIDKSSTQPSPPRQKPSLESGSRVKWIIPYCRMLKLSITLWLSYIQIPCL